MPMRICIATPDLSAYSETFIRDHIERLPFDVITLSGRHLLTFNGAQRFKINVTEQIWARASKKFSSFNRTIGVAQKQAHWLKKQKAQAVLAEYGTTGVQLLSTCRIANIPLIVHFHGYDAHNREVTNLNMASYQKMFSQSAAIIGVSTVMCRHLIQMGAPEGKVHHIPCSVDIEKFTLGDPSKSSQHLLAIGRFVEKKAPYLTIMAFKQVLQHCPDAVLELAGDGVLLGPCKRIIQALHLEEHVILHGSQEHDWVASKMRKVRAFVQHSVEDENGDSEGTPVAVLEAQCSGLPVVATRHAGIADVVIDGETGFLSEEGDVDRMAQNMIKVLLMPSEQLKEMSMKARQRILTHFSSDQTIGKLASVIKQATQA